MKKPKKKSESRPQRVKVVPLEGKTTPVTLADIESLGRKPFLPFVHPAFRYLVDCPFAQKLNTAISNKKNRIPDDKQCEFDEYCLKIQTKVILKYMYGLPANVFDRLTAQVKRFR